MLLSSLVSLFFPDKWQLIFLWLLGLAATEGKEPMLMKMIHTIQINHTSLINKVDEHFLSLKHNKKQDPSWIAVIQNKYPHWKISTIFLFWWIFFFSYLQSQWQQSTGHARRENLLVGDTDINKKLNGSSNPSTPHPKIKQNTFVFRFILCSIYIYCVRIYKKKSET